MRKGALLTLAPLAALLGRPAHAASFEWSATLEGRIGYGSNPFLNRGGNGGTGLVGGTVAPVLRWRDPKSVTELSGSYNRDQYFSKYGHADDLAVDLRRTQQFSSKLSGNAHVGYYSQISGLFSPYYNTVVTDPVAVDQLAVGTRQRRIAGDAGLQWQPTERDEFHVSGVAQRSDYSRFGGDFTYIGGTAGYLRTLDQRTKVGLDVTVGHIYSDAFPDSTTYQPSLEVQRTLSARWSLNAGVGVIVEEERFGARDRTSVSPGFNASLCGTYPRLSVCFTAARAVAPSGIGGLRRQTQFGVDGTYRLSERSRINGVATYGLSDSDEPVLVDGVRYGDQRYALARLAYQRDLSRRVAAGVSGNYQERSGGGLRDVHAVAITFNLTARLGRLT